jgi:hypothetical protein
MSIDPSKDIFDTPESIIDYCQRYLSLVEKLNQEKLKDATRTPTPGLICKELEITMEQYLDLKDFAENDFGEWHATHIMMQPHTKLGWDGKEIKPLE